MNFIPLPIPINSDPEFQRSTLVHGIIAAILIFVIQLLFLSSLSNTLQAVANAIEYQTFPTAVAVPFIVIVSTHTFVHFYTRRIKKYSELNLWRAALLGAAYLFGITGYLILNAIAHITWSGNETILPLLINAKLFAWATIILIYGATIIAWITIGYQILNHMILRQRQRQNKKETNEPL